jgi:membrane glycosyltransferase
MHHQGLHSNWERAAYIRRLILLVLIFVPSIIACGFLSKTLPFKDAAVLDFLVVVFFGILYSWITVSFWVSVAGFSMLLRRYDRFLMTDVVKTPIQDQVRIAILMPIYNEKVDRIFAGLYTIYRSLEQTGEIDKFDFFILSDTDNPDKWVEEEAAWNYLCKSVEGRNRIFYRNRHANVNRKSGNIAHFCRSWGANYRYMIVLDADSIMTGDTLVRMVTIMEQNPTVGMLQTAAKAVNAKTLFARLHQFASHLYGPIFSAGLHFWQLGDAQYWGHNAIIRIEPFMKHCALPKLPGNPPLGGPILSHDFVEAALMRSAGWGVWLAHNLRGSYEELPPTLLDHLARDRRWCQGNLQHLRLLFTKGLFPAHRALFFVGAMSYVSGLLWFLFLALSTAKAVSETLVTHTFFPSRYSLFPNWPIWHPGWVIALLTSTAFLLFSPKLLSVLIITIRQRRTNEFGGILKLLSSVTAEVILSTLLAPVMMMFHSKFVFLTLLGRQVRWDAQQREERSISWGQALRFHGTGMALGFVWGAAVLLINPSFFWWLTPIIAALILSIPLSVWSSRTTVGEKFRHFGLFLTPEETAPHLEFSWLDRHLKEYRSHRLSLSIDREQGFVRAVVDPCINALHLLLLRKERRYSQSILRRKQSLIKKALLSGPDQLILSEKRELLSDPSSMKALHMLVWKSRDEATARMWGIVLP